MQKPAGLPQELWERVVSFKQDEEEFRERKERFLSSLETGDDKMMDRALAGLRKEEDELKTRGVELSQALRERFGLEL